MEKRDGELGMCVYIYIYVYVYRYFVYIMSFVEGHTTGAA